MVWVLGTKNSSSINRGFVIRSIAADIFTGLLCKRHGGKLFYHDVCNRVRPYPLSKREDLRLKVWQDQRLELLPDKLGSKLPASPVPDSDRSPLLPCPLLRPGVLCLAAMAAGMQQSSSAERLDWMYEQSAASVKPDEDTLMNMPINAQKDQDIEDVKNLQNSTAGSLFLGSATKTTEDMVRKLREDPLFQIRRQEHAARESMMTNPLIMAKIQKKREKEAKKAVKKEKKAAKKEEKALKKAAKAAPWMQLLGEAPPKRPREEEPDLSALGPSSVVVSKRMEHDERVAKQKEQALASRGLGRRLTEEEKERRVEQMRVDAKKHEKMKDQRIASTEEREKQIEELEAKMRDKSDQKYFRDLRKDAYAGDTKEMTMADRLQTQRHRRQKHLNDPLERD
ncbi:hypothetical protein AK812_SmicGene9886 [Symbiodinium microadriaticum]|uniref:Pre-mRNA-splicing factor CWC25-like n=1 Tax=Symbiodinium microadriaticum TaxID=2951 RepID=A0A1Q9EHE6_SYMMI|nr:hypothetical protein AK812_SmicGene9886 [Symbiodinium microadriaticum]